MHTGHGDSEHLCRQVDILHGDGDKITEHVVFCGGMWTRRPSPARRPKLPSSAGEPKRELSVASSRSYGRAGWRAASRRPPQLARGVPHLPHAAYRDRYRVRCDEPRQGESSWVLDVWNGLRHSPECCSP